MHVDADQTADALAHRLAILAHMAPHIPPTTASLTCQLGLDSLVLMAFLAEVRADYGVDLGPWLVQHAARGRDTLQTLADHITVGAPRPDGRITLDHRPPSRAARR